MDEITATAQDRPQGWQLVLAQTRLDESGVMTLPLTGYGFSETASVLDTHGEQARRVAAELAAGEPGYWTRLEDAADILRLS